MRKPKNIKKLEIFYMYKWTKIQVSPFLLDIKERDCVFILSREGFTKEE